MTKFLGSVRNLLALFGGALGRLPRHRRQARGRIVTGVTMLLAGS